jgi:hypothetical protein
LARARRLAAWQDVPHGRLALLLLDNVAETSLMRTAQTRIDQADMFNGMVYMLRSVRPDDERGLKLKRGLEPHTLSTSRRRQIERHFESLVNYVFEKPDFSLPVEFADCLKILHRYRNAAYHRDTVRADVVGPAVQILFFLCCHLLKHEESIFRVIGTAPPSVLEIFGDDPPKNRIGPVGMRDLEGLSVAVADRLLADLTLDHGGIAAALADHLLAWLTVLDQNLSEIGDNIPPGVNRWATLRLVQLAPRELEDFDAGRPRDFWTRPLPVTEEVLEAWTVKAKALRNIPIAHHALRAFAEVEEPLEELEEPVERFIEDIDRAEQQRIDEMRGK